MKILIVGLGSMGKRRARLTKGIDSSIRIAGVDTAESRRAEATDLGLIDAAYPSIAEAVAAEAPDAALVCTAPLTHAAIISELLCTGCRFLVVIGHLQCGEFCLQLVQLALGGVGDNDVTGRDDCSFCQPSGNGSPHISCTDNCCFHIFLLLKELFCWQR